MWVLVIFILSTNTPVMTEPGLRSKAHCEQRISKYMPPRYKPIQRALWQKKYGYRCIFQK